MNIKDDFILSKINEGYLVGGSVRDALMGKSFVDDMTNPISITNLYTFRCERWGMIILICRRNHIDNNVAKK